MGLAWRLAPPLVAAALAAGFLLWDPRPVDLAAHVFRAELFGDEGLSVWNGQWYAGHHTPGYSVLAPALGWLLGPALMGALSAVAGAALFEQLAHSLWGERARLGALWFGAGTATMLFSGRVTFALGVALGLGALVALTRGRAVLATGFALLCALASPVAGLFLALAGIALVCARRLGKRNSAERPAAPLAVAAAALAPPLLLAVVFPEGGEHPFPFSAYIAIPLFGLAVVALTSARDRALRIATALYVAGGTAAYVIATPLGGNSVRLGALLGGPVLACALAARGTAEAPVGRLPRVPRGVAIALTLSALLYWQVEQAIEDVNKVSGDPATEASYYAPLNDFLEREAAGGSAPFRVEIPFTRAHWEAAEVAPEFALARGWERQLDTKFNQLFYDGTLSSEKYERWLRDNGVRFVALPDATLDRHGQAEGQLVSGTERRAPPPYLRLRARLEHWRVYEVTPPPPLAVPEGTARMRVTELRTNRVVLTVGRPGNGIVRVRWSPYWRARGPGPPCVSRAGDWTRLEAPRGGSIELELSFSPLRALSRGTRCG